MNLPKRDELLFRPVFALPTASRIGFDESTFAARSSPLEPLPARERHARYRIMYLLVSVLPAPDSPETTIDCERRSFRIRWYASSADANTCGSFFEIGLFGKRPMYASS